MAFFDMYPMGGYNVGGYNVGGMNVGGYLPGTKLSDEQKARIKAKSAATRLLNAGDRQGAVADRKRVMNDALLAVQRQNPTLRLNVQKAMARLMLAERKAVKEPGVRGSKRKGKGKFIMVDGKREPNPAYEPLQLSGFPAQRHRLTNVSMKARGTTPEQVAQLMAQLPALLDQYGFGIYDMEDGSHVYDMVGSGIFDDIMHGISSVADVGTKFLPFVM